MRISDWSSDVCSSDLTRDAFAPVFGLQFDKKQDLRYGENPHQGAAFYSERNPEAGTISAATQLQGKELSYNNIADAYAALECVKAFAKPACVIVKHANTCGVAVNESSIRERSEETRLNSSH